MRGIPALAWISIMAIVIALPATAAGAAAPPKGAKAIFDSGEGPASGMSVAASEPAPAAKAKPQPPAASRQKYVGISYELLLLSDDGQIRKVPTHRTFKSGERLVMRVMTNRTGLLKIYNIGPTGNVSVLSEQMVEAYAMTQIPRTSALKFVGAPGVETILIMLGDGVGPGALPRAVAPPVDSAVSVPVAPAPPVQPAGDPRPAAPQPPDSSAVASLPPPPPLLIAGNIASAGGAKGAKDLVVEDGMKSSFAVVSPASSWQPVKSGTKDLVLESHQGTNYGVIPASTVTGGGMLSLMVKLRHE